MNTNFDASSLWDVREQLRSRSPLIHNITNEVVMNFVANGLLALGASPVMTHSKEELDEMVALAQGLALNIGSLDPMRIGSMQEAARLAKQRGIAVALDPVGAGATSFRTQVACELLRGGNISILRGNASEIAALAGQRGSAKGVDSTLSSKEALEAGQHLVEAYSLVVVISGVEDFVLTKGRVARIQNGHFLMAQVTGMGCLSTSVISAFAAVADPFEAAVYAMAFMGIVGELAAENSQGPGSFLPVFLDALNGITSSQVAICLRIS